MTDALAIGGKESFKPIEQKLIRLTEEKTIIEQKNPPFECEIEIISNHGIPQEKLQQRHAELARIYAKLPFRKKETGLSLDPQH